MSAPAFIKQADVTRMLKGARASGYRYARVTFDRIGNIVLDVSDEPTDSISERVNPLDALLLSK